jgi:DNA-binding NarL/FixJ family response regulator
MVEKITVLLVDDHILVRRALRRVLEDDASIAVIGEASDGAEAVQMARDLSPNVVLMDYALGEMNGIVATEKILATRPETAVLMLSMHVGDNRVREALDVGARGYISKSVKELDLVSAIRRVASGEIVVDRQPSPLTNSKEARDGTLTEREIEILQLIVAGKSTKEIASHLDLSANTVSAHRANLMRALGVHKTADLVRYAVRNGLLGIV